MKPNDDLLDHAVDLFPAPERSFDRLTRRRDRKRRNQRVGAGVLALAIAAVAIGGALYAVRSSGVRPATSPPAIDPSNVAGLHLAWTAQAGDAPKGEGYGVAFAGRVAVVHADGLYAFPVDCGTDASSCDPAWVAELPATSADAAVLAADANNVYVSAGDLYAFRADCGVGGVTCGPAWIGHLGSGEASRPIVSDGVVYVGGTDGRVYAFSADCGEGGSECQPLWVGDTRFGPTRVEAVSDGVVYAASGNAIAAFPVACDADCPATWKTTIRGADAIAVTGAQGVLYVGALVYGHGWDSHGSISAYAASCDALATCRPLWSDEVGGYPTSLVYANGVIYALASGPHYPFSEAAFSAGSGDLLWSACSSSKTFDISCGLHGPSPTPAVAADGLIWIVHARGTTAYPLSCGSGGAPCDPAWTSTDGIYCPGYFCASKAGLAVSSTLVVRASGDGVVALGVSS